MELYCIETVIYMADHHACGTRKMAAQTVVYPIGLCGDIPIQYITYRADYINHRTSPRTVRTDAHIHFQIPILPNAIRNVDMVDENRTAYRLRA